jgi:predicted enzyme related to lactoylglutathione lyase
MSIRPGLVRRPGTMAYKHGNFVWFELITPDVAKAKSFYPETVGWRASEMDMGGMKYTMLTHGDAPQGSIVEPQMAGVPPHWASYVSVPDVDAAAKVAVAKGGKVIVPAFDIPNIGRTALVSDPQGATLFLFKGTESDDNGSTAFHWNELWAKDAKAVLPFYEAVVGYRVEAMSMGDTSYYVLEKDGRKCGGVMTSPIAQAPAMWLPYMTVDDTDAVVGRVKRHGGEVKKAAEDIPNIGRFAVLADDAGAVFAVIRPATPA